MSNSIKIPKISKFTMTELEYFERRCNFTDEELEYFKLKSRDKTIIAISIEMNVSEAKVSTLAKDVKKKISREYPRMKEYALEEVYN